MIMKKLSEDHYIVMDDSEPEIGDWVYSMDGIHQWFGQVLKTEPLPKKITHSTNIDWNEVYYIPLSEVKELLGVVDVEKKALEISPIELDEDEFDVNETHRVTWIDGYNQALEDNNHKKWTDADVIRIVGKSRQTGLTAEYLMLSLQPKTEWEVEFVDGKLKLK